MSVPNKQNPLGLLWERGMWVEGGLLCGELFNTSKNKNITAGAPGLNAEGITDGSYMFYGDTNMEEWGQPLPKLVNGSYMFQGCKLKQWSVGLPLLKNGTYMFAGMNYTDGNPFTEWKVDLPSLETGDYMFEGRYFTDFSIDLPRLKTANYMFRLSQLTHFGGKLSSSLTSASGMFWGCKLDEESVLYIFRGDESEGYGGLPAYSGGTHAIQIGSRKNWLNSVEVATLLGTTIPIAAGTYAFKGWSVTVEA